MAEIAKLRLVPPATTTEPEGEGEIGAHAHAPGRRCRIISVGGGKGGVGKSLLAANLGIALSGQGRRVLLVDADLGGANLHTCLGMDPPRRTLSDFVNHRVESLEDVIVPTGVEGLHLLSGALDHLDAANPNHGQKMRLIRRLRALDADHVILDLGAGTQLNTLDFFLLADHGVVVLVPEHTAVENAYRFVKAAYWRRLRAAASVFGLAPALAEMLESDPHQGPYQVLDALEALQEEAGAQLRKQMAVFRPALVVNQARTDEDRLLGHAVASAWRRHFGIEMDVAGTVEYDDEVWRAVRQRRPLLVAEPEGRVARSLEAIAARLRELGARAEQVE